MTIRLLIVDDHAVVRSGLKMLLENERDVEIVGEAASAIRSDGSGAEAETKCHFDGYWLA